MTPTTELGVSLVPRFKLPDPRIVRQKLHLLDSDLVQLAKPLRLRLLLLDEKRVQVFQIGKAHELRHVCVVPDIAFLARMAVALLFGGHAE